MTTKRRRVFSDPHQSVAAGVVLTAIGSWLLWEGYEKSGRNRPWLMRFLPGP